jgi:hypothetical protein
LQDAIAAIHELEALPAEFFAAIEPHLRRREGPAQIDQPERREPANLQPFLRLSALGLKRKVDCWVLVRRRHGIHCAVTVTFTCNTQRSTATSTIENKRKPNVHAGFLRFLSPMRPPTTAAGATRGLDKRWLPL